VKSPVRVVALVVAGALVALLAVLWTREPDTGVSGSSPLIGRLVPEVVGPTLGGGTFDIDDARGRWVLINFFASWCVPCVEEHPELVEFSRRHPDDGLVVSVPFGDTEANARAFFDEYGGDWPVMADPEAALAVDFAVLRPPETFLIAPNGIVVDRFIGQISADFVDDYIAAVLTSAEEGAG
jgi:cytochrome c biogenesis protein CcmG/thiol:disulfide interchange protein DsbE